MNNVKILDCTLRDGGYYNNWDFSSNFANVYLKTLAKTSIDYIEIGFRKSINNVGSGPSGLKKVGNFLTTKESLISKLSIPKKKKIAVMIDLADYLEKNSFKKIKKNFKNSKYSKIKLVRIACNEENKSSLQKIVKYLKKKNYEVAVNLMKFTIIPHERIYIFFKMALNSGADYLYLADSFGNCFPKKINKISKYLKKRINIKKLGFHAHDNTGNALKNCIAAINNGFGIVDTSIMGMGRGAGNLNLEEFLNYQNKFYEKNLVKKFTKQNMQKLHKKYKWGKNKFYSYSAKNNIHPTFVQRLLEEEKFNRGSTKKILEFLKKNNATQYDMNIFDNLFLKIQNNNQKNIKFNNNKIVLICDNQEIKKVNFRKLKIAKYSLASLNYIKFINSKNLDLIFQCNAYRVFTEVEKVAKIKNIKLIMPNYDLLKKFIKKNNQKIIKYNIIKNNKSNIFNTYCQFEKNLVLFYALSFCIAKKFKEIKIFGLTQSSSNLKILDKINKYIKEKKINILINVK